RYLMDFTSRLAGAANQAQISQANILGFASVLDQNKQQVEMSATALQKLLMNMFTAPEKYARLAGMSVKEFADALKNDANEALISFLDTLNKKGGLSELAPIFKDLGLDGARASGVISVLAGKIDDVREAQATANAAFAEGNSVINEAAAVNGNAAAQLDKAKKAVQDAKAALGAELLPVITQLTQTSAGGLRTAAAAVKFLTQHKGLVIGLGVAYGALHAAQKLVIAAQKEHVALSIKGTAVGNAYKSVVMLIAAAKARLAGSTAAATLAQKEFKAAFAATPWGAVIVAIGAVATGMGMLISKHRDAKKAAEEFNTECAREQAEAEYLFDKLKKAEKGTKDYEKALRELKEKYPEIIQQHLDEEGALRDVEQAYKDVIKQIQNKVAAQVKEEEINAATEEGIKDMVKATRGFNDQQKAVIKQMAESGASAKEIGDAIGISYYFTDYRGERVKDERFQRLEKYVEAYSKMRKDIEKIDKQYAPYIESVFSASTGTGGTGGTGEDGGDDGKGGGDGSGKSLKSKMEDFQKDLAKFVNVQRTSQMTEWAKTKAQIDEQYNQLLARAKELYGEGSKSYNDITSKLVTGRAQQMSEAMAQYIKTLTDAAKKADGGRAATGSPLLDAVYGEQDKWDEQIGVLKANIAAIDEVLKDMDPESSDWAEANKTRSDFVAQSLTLLENRAKAVSDVIKTYTQSDTEFIKQKTAEIERARMSEHDRQVAEIKDVYNTKIAAKRAEIAALEQLMKENPENKDIPEQIEELKKVIRQLESLMGIEISNVPTGGGKNKSVWQQIAEFDWSDMGENWQIGLDLMTQGLQDLASAAFDVYGSILQIQSNTTEAEIKNAQEAYDAKTASLKRQLDQGLISQKRYDAQVEKLTEEKERKEKKLKHEQFAREKTANIIQATITGILAAMNSFSQNGGFPWGLVPMAISTAMTGVQIAAIASQPNPYYMGGYIRGLQYAVMGERGDEWVASHQLLANQETASIIAALDEYQKGNRSALSEIRFSAPDSQIVSQAARQTGGNFAASNQTSNYYQTVNTELLREVQKMNMFLMDPNNRRAYISRRIQLEFDQQEEEVRTMARL
nr:phage tail tape measure protein [Bacteroidales bacterium]